MKKVPIELTIKNAASLCHTLCSSEGFGRNYRVHEWDCETVLELMLVCKVLDGLNVKYQTDEFVWDSGQCDQVILIDIPWEPYIEHGLFIIEGGEV